jgi:histidyl-tRNA synthetase
MEETDLYRAKTGEEIVNEQTYSFTDRGGRDVTLRPEMTPTVARMVAGKRKELSFPVRWYSIPNCFRYERPQRGRLREFWQLNVDMLGAQSAYADAEIIDVAYRIMVRFGADPQNFQIKVNTRTLMTEFFTDTLGLDETGSYKLSKLIDKKNKLKPEEFTDNAKNIIGNKVSVLEKFLNASRLDDVTEIMQNSKGIAELKQVLSALDGCGIQNYVFDPSLMRGFDYYTGMIFEVFDTNPVNARSLFGGGRYDNLVDLFGVESVPAVGFGMGDLTMQDYLETYNLTPELSTGITLGIATVESSVVSGAINLASTLRDQGISCVVDYTETKLGKKLKSLVEQGAAYILTIGPDEFASDQFVIRQSVTSTEQSLSESELGPYLAKLSQS